MSQNSLNVALEYHERTKHHFDRYARSLGYLDWATQPNPFRQFEGALRLPLDEPPLRDEPAYDALFQPGAVAAQPVNRQTISRLFYHALALSAWKQAPGTPPWSLRINPSSGALHPTEGYLVAGPIDGLSTVAAVYHYAAHQHELEQRRILSAEDWHSFAAQMPPGAVLIGLTSIHWRESWKYGERAFRYCHHDVGHAIAAVAFAAATLGWQARLVDSLSADELALLLDTRHQQGPEAEHPDCVLAVFPACDRPPAAIDLAWPAALGARLQRTEPIGVPNRLSRDHQPWPAIDKVALATRREPAPRAATCPPAADAAGISAASSCEDSDLAAPPRSVRPLAAEQIIRQRRSAVALDGQTALDRDAFYAMLARLMPASAESARRPRALPFATLPWPVHVSLALFVHRVGRLAPGLYLLARDLRHATALRGSLRTQFLWQRPDGCPAGLPLWLLLQADCRPAARTISCHQAIAADGVFSLGMLAEFEPVLREFGPPAYPRLFWEAGLIGQVLYLEAEAAGIRGTGIGCFFDDAMHDVLGIRDRRWQTLYHFTVGGPVDDPRLQTIPPYAHRTPNRTLAPRTDGLPAV